MEHQFPHEIDRQSEIDELVARAKASKGRMKSIVDKADAEKRDLSAAEAEQANRLWEQAEQALAQADVLAGEIRSGAPARATTSAGRVSTPFPTAGQSRPTSGGDFNGSPKFYNMFPNAKPSGRSEFDSLGSFARAVHQNNPRLFQNASGMSSSPAADGGYYIPVQMYANLMDDSLQQEAIRPGATIVPMTSAQCNIPMFDLSNRSTGIATLEGKLTAEGATAATQKAKAREINLTAKKISVLVPTTTELLQDAPQLFGQLLQRAMTDALAQTLDSWFIAGTGVGSPLGILSAPCTVSLAKDSGQVAGTVTPTNVAGMVSRLAPGSWARAVWIVSPSALAQLFTLTTVTKNVAGTENVGGHAPEFFNVLPNGEFSLLGRPLIVSDRCAALGTVGDILLVDRSQYLIGLRQDAVLAVDNSIGFKESEVWFRLSCRIDGQPAQAAPITPRVGSATLSPFVSLATRS